MVQAVLATSETEDCMPMFEAREGESLRRSAKQIADILCGKRVSGSDASKLAIARAVASLIESAEGFCGVELAAERARRALLIRRVARGFCMTCGTGRISGSSSICSACDDRDLS